MSPPPRHPEIKWSPYANLGERSPVAMPSQSVMRIVELRPGAYEGDLRCIQASPGCAKRYNLRFCATGDTAVKGVTWSPDRNGYSSYGSTAAIGHLVKRLEAAPVKTPLTIARRRLNEGAPVKVLFEGDLWGFGKMRIRIEAESELWFGETGKHTRLQITTGRGSLDLDVTVGLPAQEPAIAALWKIHQRVASPYLKDEGRAKALREFSLPVEIVFENDEVKTLKLDACRNILIQRQNADHLSKRRR